MRLGGAAVEEEVEDGAGDEDEVAGQHRGEVASVIRRRRAVGEAGSRSRTRGRRRGAMTSGEDRRRRGCKASGAAVATDGIRTWGGEGRETRENGGGCAWGSPLAALEGEGGGTWGSGGWALGFGHGWGVKWCGGAVGPVSWPAGPLAQLAKGSRGGAVSFYLFFLVSFPFCFCVFFSFYLFFPALL